MLTVSLVNHEGNVHYFKFFILRSVMLTQFRKAVGVQRGRRDNTILHRQKRLFSFHNGQLCIS